MLRKSESCKHFKEWRVYVFYDSTQTLWDDITIICIPKKKGYVNYFRSEWCCSDENKSICLVFILLLIFQSDRLRDNIDWQCALFSRVTRDSPFTTWESWPFYSPSDTSTSAIPTGAGWTSRCWPALSCRPWTPAACFLP